MKRWGVALYGRESKTTTPVTFIKFWRKWRAMDEAARLNKKFSAASHGDSLVRYVVFDYMTRQAVNDG